MFTLHHETDGICPIPRQALPAKRRRIPEFGCDFANPVAGLRRHSRSIVEGTGRGAERDTSSFSDVNDRHPLRTVRSRPPCPFTLAHAARVPRGVQAAAAKQSVP
jgi:hypothetical protein